jgi:hypothetical protein
MATSLSLQIEQMQVTLTAAAEQIATLNSQEKTLAAAATVGSQSGSSSSYGYSIPSNVYTVTIIDDAFLEIPHGINDKGVPIMQQVQPQIRLDPGFQTWVYKERVPADGGGVYFQVFDPDGEQAEDYHLRLRDIQIRMPNGRPNPSNFPSDVAKAVTNSTAIGYYIDGYDEFDRPIMEATNPRISYDANQTVLVHAGRVIASGFYVFYAEYDPDGNPGVFILGEELEFLKVWD